MNMRTLLIALAMALLVSGVAALTGFSQDEITHVRDSYFGERIRPAVPFRHDEHNEYAMIDDCTICHHVYEDGEKLAYETSEYMQCSECHTEGGKGEMDLMRAYHLNCKGCHQEEKAGPVTCGECHSGEGY